MTTKTTAPSATRDAMLEQQSTDAPSQDGREGLRRSLRAMDYATAAASLSPVQGKALGRTSGDVHAAAAVGTRGSGGTLPFLGAIQASFGRHDVSGIAAHQGSEASAACDAMQGATAYASGNDVAFAGSPDLHTAAHEAAHVVQQRGGVSLKGGVGAPGDTYERHADQVAGLVVQGKSAEGLLDRYAGGSAMTSGDVQMDNPYFRRVESNRYERCQDDGSLPLVFGSNRTPMIGNCFGPDEYPNAYHEAMVFEAMEMKTALEHMGMEVSADYSEGVVTVGEQTYDLEGFVEHAPTLLAGSGELLADEEMTALVGQYLQWVADNYYLPSRPGFHPRHLDDAAPETAQDWFYESLAEVGRNSPIPGVARWWGIGITIATFGMAWAAAAAGMTAVAITNLASGVMRSAVQIYFEFNGAPQIDFGTMNQHQIEEFQELVCYEAPLHRFFNEVAPGTPYIVRLAVGEGARLGVG